MTSPSLTSDISDREEAVQSNLPSAVVRSADPWIINRTRQGGGESALLTTREPTLPSSAGSTALASQPRSADMLIAAAAARLQRLTSEGLVANTFALQETVRRLLSLLIEQGGPLPQLCVAEDKGIEVNWLVDGQLVALVVDAEGEWVLWGQTGRGVPLFEAEGTEFSSPPVRTLLTARSVLLDMGERAKIWTFPYP